jgi:phosphatidate cytidylyltransferase
VSGVVRSELRQRVVTAIALMAIVVVALFALPAFATWALIALAILGGAWEWSAFLHPHRQTVRVAYVCLVGLGLLAGWLVTQEPDTLVMLMTIAFLWWCTALAWILGAPARGGAVTAAMAGVFTLIPTGVALIALRQDSVFGALVLLFSLLVILAADVAAYFAGHRWGRRKLAPQVSPGKTWEGVAGGVLGAVLVAAVGASVLGWPVGSVAILAMFAAGFSIIGDLTESLMKRHTGLKDSGRLFPGHGGLLDRLDSLSAGLPVWVLGLHYLGLMSGVSQ